MKGVFPKVVDKFVKKGIPPLSDIGFSLRFIKMPYFEAVFTTY